MPTREAASTTQQIGDRLVELCRSGRNLDAISELYADDVVSFEAQGTPDYPAELRGKQAIVDKNEKWQRTNEVHRGEVEGPFPHGDRFAVKYHFDVTPSDGPMAGQRFQMDEVALYTVKNGKIAREEFFYSMG